MSEIYVLKRDGSKEPLNLDKFHKVVSWACEDITGVSPSEIEIKSHVQFYNNIKSNDIQETLIKASADLISEETPNYQYVAGRLINYHLRKHVYGQFEPPRLYDHIKKVVEIGAIGAGEFGADLAAFAAALPEALSEAQSAAQSAGQSEAR